MNNQYAVIIERGKTGSYGAYIPDLPERVAAADTESEGLKLIGEAMEDHLRSTREDGDPLPEPSTRVEYLAVAS